MWSLLQTPIFTPILIPMLLGHSKQKMEQIAYRKIILETNMTKKIHILPNY